MCGDAAITQESSRPLGAPCPLSSPVAGRRHLLQKILIKEEKWGEKREENRLLQKSGKLEWKTRLYLEAL